MKNKEFLLKLNLQHFAEGGEGGTGGTGGAAGGEGGEGAKTFDDILKDKAHQSEFDKRIAKSLETAKAKWEADYNQKLEDAKTEAAKLAKMTADEKAKHEEEKRIAELEKREKEITTRELKAQAYETLASKNLPKELIDTLVFTDAEQCNKSIEAVEKAFQAAVEKAVNEKLKGKEIPKGGSGSTDDSDAALRRAFGLK